MLLESLRTVITNLVAGPLAFTSDAELQHDLRSPECSACAGEQILCEPCHERRRAAGIELERRSRTRSVPGTT